MKFKLLKVHFTQLFWCYHTDHSIIYMKGQLTPTSFFVQYTQGQQNAYTYFTTSSTSCMFCADIWWRKMVLTHLISLSISPVSPCPRNYSLCTSPAHLTKNKTGFVDRQAVVLPFAVTNWNVSSRCMMFLCGLEFSFGPLWTRREAKQRSYWCTGHS